MKTFLNKKKWSPYLVGGLIGGLLTLLLLMGKQLGVSTGIARIAALLEAFFIPQHLQATPYFKSLLATSTVLDWKILFAVGIFFGSFFSSRLSNNSKNRTSFWKNSWGDQFTIRALVALIGGILLMFGARIANGCTSGHAISGGAQLSITSWLFMMSLFATAIPTSWMMYKRKRG